MIMNWLSNVYQKHGYIATLVTIVVLVLLFAGISWVFDLDIGGVADWLRSL